MGSNQKIQKLLDGALIGICTLITSNTVFEPEHNISYNIVCAPSDD